MVSSNIPMITLRVIYSSQCDVLKVHVKRPKVGNSSAMKNDRDANNSRAESDVSAQGHRKGIG